MRKSRLRGQSPAKHSTASRPGTRARKDAKYLARDEEKENIGTQTTVSRQHRRSGVLSATTTLGVSSTAVKPVSKGVRKSKASQVKEKKLPLQDITSQFLPAPESANRGAGSEYTAPLQALSYPISVPNTPHRPNLPLSPLPPSSPPLDLVLPSAKTFEDSTDDHLDDHLDIPSFSDGKYVTENDQQTSSSSDPFGFAALERKLKAERELVTSVFDTHEDEDIYEELDEILVADTSSPRAVRRMKRSLSHIEEGERRSSQIENRDEGNEGALVPLAHPHFCTPPTPHKDKTVHRRLSYEGPNVFSPCSSSLESSPSPTKTSANKRRRDLLYAQDPLEEFNAAVDESGADFVIDNPPSKRQCQVPRKQDDGHHNTITRNLRPRRPAATEKTNTVPKPQKDISRAKPSRKAKPNSSKKGKKVDDFNDDDLEEKWKQEREDRIKFLDRLAEYSVEKENVYII